MTLLTPILQKARHKLRYLRVGRALRGLGVTSIARDIYVRSVLREGTMKANVLGHELNFRIEHTQEITRVDTIERELEFLERITNAIRPGDIVFDVGANVGTVSLLLAKSSPHARVEAFEPETRNAARLRENVLLNGLDNIRVHETALSDTTGLLEFHVHGTTGTGSHSLVDTADGGETVTVNTTKGELFVRELNVVPNVMKIDVEGAELAVLRGFDSVLTNPSLRDLFIEVHPKKLAVLGAAAQDLDDLVKKSGFALQWAAERGGEEHRHYSKHLVSST